MTVLALVAIIAGVSLIPFFLGRMYDYSQQPQKYHEYTKPNVSFFGTEYGYYWTVPPEPLKSVKDYVLCWLRGILCIICVILFGFILILVMLVIQWAAQTRI